MICRRCYISGRVQGVWYRGSTQQRAAALGLTGYARNLPDGRVEVLVCGTQGAVDSLCEWLWQGASNAKVSDVVCEPVESMALTAFTIG